MNYLNEIKKNIFIIFIIAFLLYYNICVNTDTKGIFFIIVIIIVLYVFYYQKIQVEEKKNSNVNKQINDFEKTLDHDYELAENKIYAVHKTPRNLKYIKQTQDIKQIVYELRFLQIYDEELYEKIVSYIEYFLKIHYNTMLGKYDFGLYFPVLKDIRNEILNSMKTIYFNIPNVSTILDIKNIDNYVEQRILRIQSITLKYLKILYNKYKSLKTSFMRHEAPFEYDKMKEDDHYNLF